jgi:hypothetical protein
MIREGRNSPSTTIRNTPNEATVARIIGVSSPPNPRHEPSESAVGSGTRRCSRSEAPVSVFPARRLSISLGAADSQRLRAGTGLLAIRQARSEEQDKEGASVNSAGGCRRTRSGPALASERTHPLLDACAPSLSFGPTRGCYWPPRIFALTARKQSQPGYEGAPRPKQSRPT